jgi:hypothetical protein
MARRIKRDKKTGEPLETAAEKKARIEDIKRMRKQFKETYLPILGGVVAVIVVFVVIMTRA